MPGSKPSPAPSRDTARQRKKWRPDRELSALSAAEVAAEVKEQAESKTEVEQPETAWDELPHGGAEAEESVPTNGRPNAEHNAVNSRPKTTNGSGALSRTAAPVQRRWGIYPRHWREQRAEAEQRELRQALKRGQAALPNTPAERAKAEAEARALLRPTPVRWVWVLLPLVLLAGAASRLALPIREVAVSGNVRLSAEQVVQAAGVRPDTGWLYYGARQAQGLADEPWVAAATVTRQFPSRLHITVTERTPYAVWRRAQAQGGDVWVARDGTLLASAQQKEDVSAATDQLPAVKGWGPNRLPEALALLETLQPYHVQLVKFTPSGFTVYTAEGGAAWSGDLATLLKHSDALSRYPNKPLYIYPWGVSVQE